MAIKWPFNQNGNRMPLLIRTADTEYLLISIHFYRLFKRLGLCFVNLGKFQSEKYSVSNVLKKPQECMSENDLR